MVVCTDRIMLEALSTGTFERNCVSFAHHRTDGLFSARQEVPSTHIAALYAMSTYKYAVWLFSVELSLSMFVCVCVYDRCYQNKPVDWIL